MTVKLSLCTGVVQIKFKFSIRAEPPVKCYFEFGKVLMGPCVFVCSEAVSSHYVGRCHSDALSSFGLGSDSGEKYVPKKHIGSHRRNNDPTAEGHS